MKYVLMILIHVSLLVLLVTPVLYACNLIGFITCYFTMFFSTLSWLAFGLGWLRINDELPRIHS